VGDELYLQRLENEARIGAVFTHPNLIRVYGFDSCPGPDGRALHLLVMELVDGWSVSRILRSPTSRGAWPPRAALELVWQAAMGIGHAHRATDPQHRSLGLAHRDLKPGNLMLSRDGRVKVLDFGIAWDADRAGEATATGVVLGTPAYMSPEQALGDPVGPPTDVFALAAILFHLVAGRRLMPRVPIAAIVQTMLKEDLGLLAAELDAVVPGLGPVFARMRAPMVADRMADGAEAAEALAGLLAGSPKGLDLHGFARVLGRWSETPSVEHEAADGKTTRPYPPGLPGSLEPDAGGAPIELGADEAPTEILQPPRSPGDDAPTLTAPTDVGGGARPASERRWGEVSLVEVTGGEAPSEGVADGAPEEPTPGTRPQQEPDPPRGPLHVRLTGPEPTGPSRGDRWPVFLLAALGLTLLVAALLVVFGALGALP